MFNVQLFDLLYEWKFCIIISISVQVEVYFLANRSDVARDVRSELLKRIRKSPEIHFEESNTIFAHKRTACG